MRVNINLATHPYEDLGSFWIRWGGALAAAAMLTLALLVLTSVGYRDARLDRQLMTQRKQQIAARDQEKQQALALLNLPQNSSTRDRSQFLNDLFQRKSFSWTRVFEDLERVMPARLHIMSIQPVMEADNQLRLKLVVGGDSSEHARDLVRRMEGSQRFQQTQIDKERTQAPGQQASADPVQFEISALYVPAPENSGHGGSH